MLVNLLKAALHAWIVVINIVFQLQIVVRCVSTGECAGYKEWLKYSVPPKKNLHNVPLELLVVNGSSATLLEEICMSF